MPLKAGWRSVPWAVHSLHETWQTRRGSQKTASLAFGPRTGVSNGLSSRRIFASAAESSARFSWVRPEPTPPAK